MDPWSMDVVVLFDDVVDDDDVEMIEKMYWKRKNHLDQPPVKREGDERRLIVICMCGVKESW